MQLETTKETERKLFKEKMAENIQILKTKTHRFKKLNEPKHKNHEKNHTLGTISESNSLGTFKSYNMFNKLVTYMKPHQF